MSELVDLAGIEVHPAVAATLPAWSDIVDHLLGPALPRAVDALRTAARRGIPLIQPRSGVGGHGEMLELLEVLDEGGPGMQSVTIDSHTRLRQFRTAELMLSERPDELNGYPLVAHGWRRGRELTRASAVPLEIRHGSPDARDLFAVALAAGITSFEGGGIGYNLPYSKDVPLRASLEAWRQVDAVCGRLAEVGAVIDRELFGTLTAVLMPPALSLAVVVLEAVAAVREGVRCLSPAYPQGGQAHQDIAALRCIPVLARRYLGAEVEVFPVLHEFMGVFPRTPDYADALILQGGLVGRLGGAAKVINKTYQEAYGIPDADANLRGIRIASLGAGELFGFVTIDESRVEEEMHWLVRETSELVDEVLAGSDLPADIAAAFRAGRLDIPFSASVHAQSRVVPMRDRSGAIRLADPGRLPLSGSVLRRQARLLQAGPGAAPIPLIDQVGADIRHFLDRERVALAGNTRRTTMEGEP